MISLVINCDSRPERNQQDGLFSGVVSNDFLISGVKNKIAFFNGFDIETILFIDEHATISHGTIEQLRELVTTLVIRKHTHEEKFNDYNYLSALSLCRGEIICHIDQDCALFTPNMQPIDEMIELLEQYDYVGYPSLFSPNPDHNPNYDYYWCSTRFFMCKKETLDFTEIKKCLQDMDYLFTKYPASVHNPWLEHILALISKYTGKGVYYPPIDYEKVIIFVWENYQKGLLSEMNNQPFDMIKQFVFNCGGIHYPNNLTVPIN